MEISTILNYDDIVIQCHDEPDADALASGFALYCWLRDHDRQARFIYGGRNGSLKPNLQFMKDLLEIPVEHVTELSEPELLVMTDCQYGEKNVQKFHAKQICVIDHHQVRDRAKLPDMYEVLENYGSCSTVIYGMFLRDGYDMSGKTPLQTALLYGLYMDTSQFQELWHPADKDMWDALQPDEGILNVLKNSNIASSDLTAIGDAFAAHRVEKEHRFAITQVHTRDRNILGIVSDTLLQVDSIDACVAYAAINDIIRFSARSCTKEFRADELVQVIADGIGAAGGHMRKAAGVIFCDALREVYPDSADFTEVLIARLRHYFDSTDTVYAGRQLDMTGFGLFRKLPVHAGMADLNTVFSPNTKVMLRTLEGDIDITVNLNQLLMIGVNAETYPITRDTFNKSYHLTGNKYEFSKDYVPAVRDYMSGSQVDLSSLTQECVSLGSSLVYAKQLTRRTHVFTMWDKQKYIYGKAGDWIAVQKDRPEDVYIIAKDVFSKTYEEE
ncbi:MAG: DHH family phosphoesterase [Stomatobaculum sp.]|nr:DHH family phosphoesterase [Stomatobaculum sp.]